MVGGNLKKLPFLQIGGSYFGVFALPGAANCDASMSAPKDLTTSSSQCSGGLRGCRGMEKVGKIPFHKWTFLGPHTLLLVLLIEAINVS